MAFMYTFTLFISNSCLTNSYASFCMNRRSDCKHSKVLRSIHSSVALFFFVRVFGIVLTSLLFIKDNLVSSVEGVEQFFMELVVALGADSLILAASLGTLGLQGSSALVVAISLSSSGELLLLGSEGVETSHGGLV